MMIIGGGSHREVHAQGIASGSVQDRYGTKAKALGTPRSLWQRGHHLRFHPNPWSTIKATQGRGLKYVSHLTATTPNKGKKATLTRGSKKRLKIHGGRIHRRKAPPTQGPAHTLQKQRNSKGSSSKACVLVKLSLTNLNRMLNAFQKSVAAQERELFFMLTNCATVSSPRLTSPHHRPLRKMEGETLRGAPTPTKRESLRTYLPKRRAVGEE